MVAGCSWAPMSTRLHEEQLVHQQQRLHRWRQHGAQCLERCQPPPRRRHGTVLPTALPTRALRALRALRACCAFLRALRAFRRARAAAASLARTGRGGPARELAWRSAIGEPRRRQSAARVLHEAARVTPAAATLAAARGWRPEAAGGSGRHCEQRMRSK